MTTQNLACATVRVAKMLLMLSLLSVLVSWRVSVTLFAMGCCGYLVIWLRSGHLPPWLVPANE